MKTSLPSEQNLELIKSAFINSYAENNLVILFGIFLLILIIQFFLLRDGYKKFNNSKPILKVLLCFAFMSVFFTSCQIKTYPQPAIKIAAIESCNAMNHCSASPFYNSRNSFDALSHINRLQYKYCSCCGQRISNDY
jgi:hypothetical protein